MYVESQYVTKYATKEELGTRKCTYLGPEAAAGGSGSLCLLACGDNHGIRHLPKQLCEGYHRFATVAMVGVFD